MKKRLLLTIPALGLIFSAFAFLINKQEVKYKQVNAYATDMDGVAVEAGEELDTENVFYDDFSSGIDMENNWVPAKKAWGNSSVSYNSGVVPENVFYNSVDKTVVFRALGDYYQGDEFDYDLDERYGYAHDEITGGGRVYSRDGTRTGGTIKTREEYGPGRYEAKFKVAPAEGVCTAFWTFNYGDDGGDYYNEMDFELPTHAEGATGDDKKDLSFNQIICTTYKTEDTYKSQRVTNPVYLNDNKFHTYCLEWYYSAGTKKVKWFIDGYLIASWNNANHISDHVGRVTLGVWVPGRADFCGIPNFDKAYMELDYFKYTPFKNQLTDDTDKDALKDYVKSYTTITSTPRSDFVPQGDFKYGLPEFYDVTGNVTANKSYDYAGSNNSYGVKIAGAGGAGASTLSYTNPNIKGIKKLELSFKYKGYGSVNVYADEEQILQSDTLASRNEWATFDQVLTVPTGKKTIKVEFYSESNDFGFFVDNIVLTYPESEVPTPNPNGHTFFTKNNGQTSTNSYEERRIAPNGDNTQIWRFTNAKYTTNNSANTIALKANSTVMSSTSGNFYYPIKQALSGLYTNSDELFAAVAEFDVDDFEDIEVDLTSYSGVSGRSLTILYSLNEGDTWSILSTTGKDQFSTGITPFRYYVRTLATQALKGRTARFAIVGNKGSGSDSYYLVGVIINNYQSFKNKLDTALCSTDDDTKVFLAHQYSQLTNDEKTLLESEQMVNYSQSYADGYAYLLAYWDGGAPSVKMNASLSSRKENAIAIIVAVLVASSLVAALVINKRKKTNQ